MSSGSINNNNNDPAIQARVAVIILDSGFSRESVARVQNLLGYYDLNNGIAVSGMPVLEGETRDLVLSLSQDPLNHGTIILDRLLDLDPSLPVVLVRAFARGGGLIRSRFENGQLVADGWTEAYLWAQNLCAQKGFLSVANCSFGGFHHALDGSGWESFQLARVVGAGKPGHLLAAAAGPGDGRAIHASLTLEAGAGETVHARQESTTTYNLWVGRLQDSSAPSDFDVRVTLNEQELLTCHGLDLVSNIWNGKQQLTFEVSGGGDVFIAIELAGGEKARFDLFISREDGARFQDFVDSELVCEPAVLAEVIAVGLKEASYGNCRINGLSKPEILLAGSGPISFRTPEITFALARLLAQNPELDVPTARARLQHLQQ